MGCVSSKRIESKDSDVFKPSPAGFLVFDINAIEEPWKKETMLLQDHEKLPSSAVAGMYPSPRSAKLAKFESAMEQPLSWTEVRKDLEKDFKSQQQPKTKKTTDPQKTLTKRNSIHTLEELESKVKRGGEAKPVGLRRTRTDVEAIPPPLNVDNQNGTIKSLKDNPFIVRDRMEREKEGAQTAFDRMSNHKRDPLAEYPERCPPGGENSLVVYTTSLRGVRKTFEDCVTVRSILENHHVVFDERDVSLHGEFLKELRRLVEEAEGAAVGVPRVFLKGRDLGGVDAVVELNETGRLGRMIGWAKVERRLGWQSCDACGGAKFVPCLVCHGSCKLMSPQSGAKERCTSCNENGLVRCPACY